MNRWWSAAVVLVLALAAGSVCTAGREEKTRNPFDVKDVPDPNGEDVKEFAAKVKLSGDGKDANAAEWAAKATAGKASSLDGEWSSRWNGGSSGNDWTSGTATVQTAGDRVYILYKDQTGTYLIDARREGKRRLVGRYLKLDSATDASPWVDVVVDDERIDGEGTMGRWDLRRKVADDSYRGAEVRRH
jgi:hypothetical protein